jgi:hypothetical protein
MSRRSLGLIPVKKWGSNELLKSFLKDEVRGIADILISSSPTLTNEKFSVKYREFIATYRYGEEPEIRIANSPKRITEIINGTLLFEIPEAVARARFEEVHRKVQHLTEKDGYCKYCSCLIDPPEGIKHHLQSEEHKREKKLVQAKNRQFSNDMKWIRRKYSVERQRVEFELISPKTGEKIADLTIEDLIKYQEGYRKCQNCETWFEGRIDARFCSARCRVANHEKKIRDSRKKITFSPQ